MGWGSANLPLLLLLLPPPLVLPPGEWGMRFPVWFLLILTGKEDACSHYILSRGWNALLSLCWCCNLRRGGYQFWPHEIRPITEVFALWLLLFSLFG